MPKILVVDDNTDLLEFLFILLTMNNFHVKGASHKNEVMPQIDSFEPDAVLMDIMLNDADGREICREIKTIHKNLPVILLSASPTLLKNYKEYNADGAIEKPFEINKFLSILGGYVKNS